MFSRLYAVHKDDRWHWQVTIDTEADRKHRFQESNGLDTVWFLEPFLSFGQAVELCCAMEEERVDPRDRSRVAEVGGRRMAAHDRGGRIGDFGKMQWRMLQARFSPVANHSYADYEVREEEYAALRDGLSGRLLLPEELESLMAFAGLEHAREYWKLYIQTGILRGEFVMRLGVDPIERKRRGLVGWGRERSWRCRRCGSNRVHLTDCPFCGGPCPYCEECLKMGRVRFCTPLIGAVSGACRRVGVDERQSALAQPYTREPVLEPWGLSVPQAEAVREGFRYYRQLSGGNADREMNRDTGLNRKAGWKGSYPRDSRFLIWAVTGAGKTEMLFPFIQEELRCGSRVLITSPRRDVVVELQPRLAKAFPDASIVTLYGGSEQRWERGDITLSTTHQLLRFEDAFDLAVVDEVDAFPFHNNPMLQYAVEKSKCHKGRHVMLTATPPASLRRLMQRKVLAHVKVPVRYHRRPLPVPRQIGVPPIRDIVKRRKLPSVLARELQHSLERGAQVFVFVPVIRWVEPVVSLLNEAFPSVTIRGTSSKDEDRAEKVKQFRSRDIRCLVTTTILERGVTIPKSDVLILEAHSELFDEGALVQMAGRSGRSAEDPAGKVVFFSSLSTHSQREAIRQIRRMNHLARKKGFLQ